MDYTKSIGNIVELQCLIKFMDMGFECSIPYGDASKYDFIADIRGELLRIQCKSCVNPITKEGIRDPNVITISTVAQTTNTQKTVRREYTADDIDYFATYYQGNVYLIPVEECSTSKSLRFAPPANNNKNYNKAEDYLIEKILGHKQNPIFLQQKENKTNEVLIPKQKDLCAQCGLVEVYYKGGICPKCASFNSRKVERPNREELKKMIRNESFMSIGKKYGVTDNTIRKWCKAENLPTKKGDISMISDIEWSKI